LEQLLAPPLASSKGALSFALDAGVESAGEHCICEA
jgi:hypothetical protein